MNVLIKPINISLIELFLYGTTFGSFGSFAVLVKLGYMTNKEYLIFAVIVSIPLAILSILIKNLRNRRNEKE